MAGQGETHGDWVRSAGLRWLEVESGYQRRKSIGYAGGSRSLEHGLRGTLWAHELGNYPLQAALAVQQQDPRSRLRALQAAGKTAAVGRALYATLVLQFNPDELTEDDAHRVTFLDLRTSFPKKASGFEFTLQSPQYPPLAEAIDALHIELTRPLEPDGLHKNLQWSGQLCRAASQLFMDYLVLLCPPERPIVLPHAGVPSGVVRPWQPALEI